MPQLSQGLIVAVLMGLLLAVIVGFYLRQGQINELTEALEESQARQAQLEQEHEQRLRAATEQLQRDYEAQLAEKMEQYQTQMEVQRQQLEAEYQSRQSLLGSQAPEGDVGAEQRIRRQYETRLKEVAAKMQQAYEQHLQEKLLEARSQAQQEYDQRLAEAIARYQDQSQTAPGAMGLAASEMGTAPIDADLEARLQAEYNQRLGDRIAEYQDDLAQRMAQLEQEYEARLQMAMAAAPSPAPASPSEEELEINLRRELEASLRAEYEKKLAENIDHYRDELARRTQELGQTYEARLRLAQAAYAEGRIASLDPSAAGPPAPGAAAAEDDSLSALLEGTDPGSPYSSDLADLSPEDLDLESLLSTTPLDTATDDVFNDLDNITGLG